MATRANNKSALRMILAEIAHAIAIRATVRDSPSFEALIFQVGCCDCIARWHITVQQTK